MGIKRSRKDQPVEADIKQAKEKGAASVLNKKYRDLMRMYGELQGELEEAFKLKKPFHTVKITPKHPSDTSEATAFIVASDWHIEEEVRPETVNHLNTFNLGVARQRIETFFKHSLVLLNIAKKDIKIDTIVFCVLGDFITGTSHPEFAETNLMLPGDAAWQAQRYLVSGLEFYLRETDCKIVVVCHSGNHGRMTHNIHIGAETGNSLETYMYRNMAQYFANEPRVKFVVADGYHTYLDVYSMKVRIHHGHAIRYGGGVGGIYIPVNKAIAQWNKGQRADLDVFGHFHQQRDGGNFICNGSLIGFNAYALSIKADYEPPRQSFFLLDKKRGKTIVAPITLEE